MMRNTALLQPLLVIHHFYQQQVSLLEHLVKKTAAEDTAMAGTTMAVPPFSVCVCVCVCMQFE